jgi:hypothetical protein
VSNRKHHREIWLSSASLSSETKPAKSTRHALFRFRLTDLLLRKGGEEISEDLGPEEFDLQSGKRRDDIKRVPPEKVCPCLLVLITSKTPGGTNEGSRYSNGEWKKDPFKKKLQETLNFLKAGFEDWCLTIREVDLSNKKYADYYVKDINGKGTSMLNPRNLEPFLKEVRKDIGIIGTPRCFTILFSCLHAFPDALGAPVGTTPTTLTPVAGSTPPTWTAKSENFSFVSDTAKPYAMAHEIVHQAGVTHAKDNKWHADKHGNPDPKAEPAGDERDKSDLMHHTPKEPCALNAKDAGILRDYVKANKCCDIAKPSESSVR